MSRFTEARQVLTDHYLDGWWDEDLGESRELPKHRACRIAYESGRRHRRTDGIPRVINTEAGKRLFRRTQNG